MNVWEQWIAELRHAYRLAKGERAAELRAGKRPKLLDDRGLHPYSEVWGRIIMLEGSAEIADVIANAPELFECSPSSLRRVAHQDAHEEFVREIRGEQ